MEKEKYLSTFFITIIVLSTPSYKGTVPTHKRTFRLLTTTYWLWLKLWIFICDRKSLPKTTQYDNKADSTNSVRRNIQFPSGRNSVGTKFLIIRPNMLEICAEKRTGRNTRSDSRATATVGKLRYRRSFFW